LGILAAVAFATILAVVAGLTLAGASAISHDLYAGVIRQGRSNEADEVRVAKTATVVLGVLAVLLGLLFESINVAFLVGLAFAIAASANFPALVLSVFWRKLSTAGAVASIYTGLILAVVLILLSPTVWVKLFGNSDAIFPWLNPTLISMPCAFAVGILVSILKPDADAEAKFESQKLRTYLGVGAE
jgi:cation/acetate symporter